MKRLRIKNLICVMAFMLIWVAIQTSHAQAINKSNWYQSVLNSANKVYTVKNTYGSTFKVSTNQFTRYLVRDINNDGVKELFLSDTKGSWINGNNQVLVLTYYKKKVKPVVLFTNPAGAYISYKGKYLTYYTRTAGQNMYDIYKLSEGKLKSVVSLEDDNYTYSSSKKKQIKTYRKNNKKCSYTVYKKCLKTYVNSGKKAVYSKKLTATRQSIVRMAVGTWYANSSVFKNDYYKISTTSIKTYNRKSGKLRSTDKIVSAYRSGNVYKICLKSGGEYWIQTDWIKMEKRQAWLHIIREHIQAAVL